MQEPVGSDLNEMLSAAVALHLDGDVDAAETKFAEIFAVDPKYGPALYWYGEHFLKSGQYQEAFEMFQKAVSASPPNNAAWNRLGELLLAQRHIDRAFLCFRSGNRGGRPDLASLINFSRVASAKGFSGEALRAACIASVSFPSDGRAHARAGAEFLSKGQIERAIEALSRTLIADPIALEANLHIALAYGTSGESQKRQKHIRKAILISPSTGGLYPHLEHLASGAIPEIDELVWAMRAAHLLPEEAGFRARIAVVRYQEQDFKGAASAARAAMILNPAEHAAHHFLAASQMRRDLIWPARKACRWSEVLYPDLVENVFVAAACAFRSGDISEGWRLYEKRFDTRLDTQRRSFPPLWDRVTQQHHLLVAAEQGLGDEYIFLSRLPDILERVEKVTVECDRRNVALFTRSMPGVTFIERQLTVNESGATIFDYSTAKLALKVDRAILAGSLLGMLIGRADRAGPKSFLVSDMDEQSRWKARFSHSDGRPLIGICWRGGARSKARSQFYCSAEELIAVLGAEVGHFVSLVYNLAPGELDAARQAGADIVVPDNIDQRDELDRVAAMLSALDAVVSVDTAVCTLAAAVGTPTIRLGRSLLYQSDGYDAVLGSCHPMLNRKEPYDLDEAMRRAHSALRDILAAGA